uniref:NAChR alpha4-like protein n=1 Tax=Parasacculina yatsui TaxID=2836420 RepID=A0A8K1RBY6_9CRUS|nr:nAChR alpha4-like protein [Parasacculina yatsui]
MFPEQRQCLALLLVATCGSCLMDQKRLHSDLLAAYNKDVRPILNGTGAINVQFGIALIDFELDPKSDILDSFFWIRMKWMDQYLRWDPEQYGGVSVIRFNQDDIWKPDIFLYNSWDSVSLHQSASIGAYPLVVPSGEVLWVPSVRLRSRCSIDRTNWPREEATCHLKFGSWTHHGFSLNLTLYASVSDIDMSDFIGSQRWSITNRSTQLVSKFYQCCEEPYPSVEYNITMVRQEYRTAELTLPILMAAAFMLLSFLVPVDHSQKLTLGWVSLLTALLGALNLYNSLSDLAHGQATIASFYSSFVTILVCFYAAEVLLVRISRLTSALMPKCLKVMLTGFLGRLLCLEAPLFDNYSQEDNEMLDQTHQTTDGIDSFCQATPPISRKRSEAGSCLEWQLLASAADRLLAAGYVAVMIIAIPPNITWS